jgi:hypothetical protein
MGLILCVRSWTSWHHCEVITLDDIYMYWNCAPILFFRFIFEKHEMYRVKDLCELHFLSLLSTFSALSHRAALNELKSRWGLSSTSGYCGIAPPNYWGKSMWSLRLENPCFLELFSLGHLFSDIECHGFVIISRKLWRRSSSQGPPRLTQNNNNRNTSTSRQDIVGLQWQNSFMW